MQVSGLGGVGFRLYFRVQGQGLGLGFRVYFGVQGWAVGWTKGSGSLHGNSG